ncbi:MAG: hypothetical protein L6Q99_04580 [Planctomycetes bacterium]|nr:hypothetical protein [Planctomycetota bacterium]
MRSSWLVPSIVVCCAGSGWTQAPFQSWTAPNGSEFGADVATVGDFDGDGVEELAISAPSANVGLGDNGVVFVYSPHANTPLLTIAGTVNADFLGFAISGLDDVDSDGTPDLLAARQGGFSQRSIDCFSGASGAKLYSASLPFAWPVSNLRLVALDDLDLDGVRDFAAALPYGGTVPGIVQVRSGATGVELYSLSPGVTHLGLGLAVLSDLDGDGARDFAASGDGAALVFSAKTGALLTSHASSSSAFGRSVAFAGDLDQDGVGDLVVAEQGPDTSGFAALARLHYFSHATGASLRVVEGPCSSGVGTAGEGFGWDLAHLGDVDADGFDDVAVGGAYRGVAAVVSGSDGSLLWEVRGSNAVLTGPLHRTVVRATGDVDLDGRPDLAVAFPDQFYDNGLSEVRVYTSGVPASVGTALGFGDGTGAPCPCGNVGQPGAGCANSTGLGATLAAFGSSSVANDPLWLRAEHLPSKANSILVVGTTQFGGGLGTPFGDGLLVAGGATKRIQPQSACPNGAQTWGSGLRSIGLWGAGQTRTFQVWYRNPTGPCGGGYNLTNAVAVTFVP